MEEHTKIMFQDFLVNLPVFACLTWVVIVCLMAARTRTFAQTLTVLLVEMVFVYASASHISPDVTPRGMMVSGILRATAGTALIPVCWLYMTRLREKQAFRGVQMIWMVIPAILFAATALLSVLSGTEEVQDALTLFHKARILPADKTLRAHIFVTGPLFFSLIALEVLIYSVMYVQLMYRDNLRLSHMGKFFRGFHVRTAEIQHFNLFLLNFLFLLMIYLPRNWFVEARGIRITLACLLTIGTFLFGFIALFGAKEKLSWKEMWLGFRYNYDDDSKAEVMDGMLSELVQEADESTLQRLRDEIATSLAEEPARLGEAPAESPKSPASQIFSAVAKSWDEDSLLARFERLIFGKQLFLEPGLTLLDVAEKLNTNKTYISRLINNTYEMGFPDLINALRVDYAEQYIVAHPDARQAEIAQACGFSSASSFNNIFKKITGMTPKIWLATNESSQGQR